MWELCRTEKKYGAPFKKVDFAAFVLHGYPGIMYIKCMPVCEMHGYTPANEDAKNIFLKFCDWAINITASLTDAQMQSMLDMEHGGMNEIFADAYQMTGEEKYLIAAKRFSHKMLLDAMAAEKDNLDNKHANTQVPKAIGFERIGELANDE